MLTKDRYAEAAEWAQKAQICFNECVQSLTPHWGLLKRDELQDCEDLKQTGLLQAVQLYKLMYGGKVLQMGITRAYSPSVRPHPHPPLYLCISHCGRVVPGECFCGDVDGLTDVFVFVYLPPFLPYRCHLERRAADCLQSRCK